MLKKLTAILMSLTLMLSVTAVFAAEAPTLVQTSATLTDADVITLAGYTDTTDAENPVVKYKAYRNRSVFSGSGTYDFLRDNDAIDIYGYGWNGLSYWGKGGIPYDYVKNYYRIDLSNAKIADKIEFKLNFDYYDYKNISTEVYMSPVDETEAAALYGAATDKSATLVSADVVPTQQDKKWTTGTMAAETASSYSPAAFDVTGYVNKAIEAGQDYVTFEVNVHSNSSTIRSLVVYSRGDKQAQVVFTNSVVSFENLTSETHKVATTEFAMTDSANPETVVTSSDKNYYFGGKEMFVKADLSEYSDKELESAALAITSWGGTYNMKVYKLDDYAWDPATLTYNLAKEKIEAEKAGDPDAAYTVKNSYWTYELKDLISSDGTLNIMIVHTDTNASKTLYGPESTHGPKIILKYYDTAEAIADATAMKIKASAASYEAGTAAVPFAALYDSTGALSEVIMGSVITAGSAAQTTEIAITAAQATAASTIKVFMWAEGTLVPLNDVVSQINK